jgi:hypothetical protein
LDLLPLSLDLCLSWLFTFGHSAKKCVLLPHLNHVLSSFLSSPGSGASSRTTWSATLARPLQAHRTPRLAKTSKRTKRTSWCMG